MKPVAKRTRPAATSPQAVASTTHPHTLTASQATKKLPLGCGRSTPQRLSTSQTPSGVTPEQAARAIAFIQATARDLAKYAQVSAAITDGYIIGDAGMSFEHCTKWSLLNDGRVLNTAARESWVFKVRGDVRTLVSAIFVTRSGSGHSGQHVPC